MPSFQDDIDAVKTHTNILLLSDDEGRQVAVAPLLQGRVLTSAYGGPEGFSHGWVNREKIASRKIHPQFNAYGGEDRFWLGPEGGQYGLFFAPGASFDVENAYVPASFDRESFDLVGSDRSNILMSKRAHLRNYSGFEFDLEVKRDIRLLSGEETGLKNKSLQWVAFESVNTLTNRGNNPWTESKGLLSIWILGIFQPSPRAVIVLPYQKGPEESLGPKVNDSYFGKLDGDGLRVGERAVFFKGDGQFRSKIGVSPRRAQPWLGSWDAGRETLTLVHYNLPDRPGMYVNSMWEIQKEPYGGDVVNSYNDGPAKPGRKPDGPYFELETSSPAAALNPGETLTHRHQTFHLSGDRKVLEDLCREKLYSGLTEIEEAFSKPTR